MTCQSCGAVGEGRFCAGCGAPLPQAPAPDPADHFWQDPGIPPSGPADWTQPPAPAAPPPPPGPRRWPLVVAGLVVVAAVIGGGVWALTAPDSRVVAQDSGSTSAPLEPAGQAPAAPGSEAGPSGEAEGSTTPETSSTSSTATQASSSSTSSSSTSTPRQSAREQLSSLRRDSLDRIDRDGSWGATLSAKYDGIRDPLQTTSSGSHVFREADILRLHEDLEEFHSEDGKVYLLTSRDLKSTATSSYEETLWMTVIDPGNLGSRESAVRWCERTFPNLSGDKLENACYPRQLTAP